MAAHARGLALDLAHEGEPRRVALVFPSDGHLPQDVAARRRRAAERVAHEEAPVEPQPLSAPAEAPA